MPPNNEVGNGKSQEARQNLLCAVLRERQASTGQPGNTSLQIAKEKIRQIETAQLGQDDIPLPTKAPLPDIIKKYLFHLKAHSSARNVQTVVSYLRGTFGDDRPSAARLGKFNLYLRPGMWY